MRCPRCEHYSESSERFCIVCGHQLARECPGCGRELRPEAQFCGFCGSRTRGVVNTTLVPETSSAVESRPLPTFFQNGRYLVKQFLGEGAAKRVYLVYDTLLDRDVAFALIETERLDDVGRKRILREAQTMARLGEHPNIVQLYDLGDENGQPYLVMSLMTGGDIEALINNAPDERLDLEQVTNIAKDICHGLAFAHSSGIVHRDLKPGNVWMTAEGTAKIGDFGLAISMERTRLTQDKMVFGTVWYVSPEQATGGDVDTRSDLYSLGCMLYHMVTGRPPFLGDNPLAIIGQHVNIRPVAPTWHVPQCPKQLDALILRLLAKNPSERPQSVSDVLYALEAIDIIETTEEPSPAPHLDDRSLDKLAGGVFVGRQREMGTLKVALEDAFSGRGMLVMLAGESGIGKTRTAKELATYAELRGAHVLWGGCSEEPGVPSYGPWVEAIRSYIREQYTDRVRSEMGVGAADIAEIVPDVRERMPELRTPPRQASPEEARFRLFNSVTAFLKDIARTQPLVLVLDDLHLSDRPSLRLLEFLVQEIAGARLLVMGTCEELDLSLGDSPAHALGVISKEQPLGRVLLTGLRESDVARFIELAAGVAPPEGLVKAVYTQSKGNPLFVTEAVRLLVQEGELNQDRLAERRSWTAMIPDAVGAVIGKRLGRLSEACDQTLSGAAVIGGEFNLDRLSLLADDLSRDQLLEVLDEALASRMIEELPGVPRRYQFSHRIVQQAFVDKLSGARQAELHARIADELEERYGADAEAHSSELAHHYANAEPLTGTRKLVRYSIAAGGRALESYAYEEALAHFEKALAAKNGEPPDGETEVLLRGLKKAQLASDNRD